MFKGLRSFLILALYFYLVLQRYHFTNSNRPLERDPDEWMGFIGRVREKSLLDLTALGQRTLAEVFEFRNEFWMLLSAKYV